MMPASILHPLSSLLFAALLWSVAFDTSAAPEMLRGELSIHDPSTIVKCEGEYWVFGTGRGVISRHSRDLVTWETGPRVFTNAPAWTTSTIPGNRGYFWAPDIVRGNGQCFLYYSVSTWGSQTSAIGLASNPTLNPANPKYAWTDQGIVIQSSPRENFNAIDPSVLLDHEGKLWMTFGSYWSGIKLIQLDPRTGRRLDTNAPIALAGQKAIEASCLLEHDGYFYLLVNWDQCCRGTNSTYNIRVGRSRSVTGPYVDEAGVDLLNGGGSLLMQTQGRFIGPGHAGLLVDGPTQWLSFHYYDGENKGVPALGLQRVEWNRQNWLGLK